MVWYSTEYSTFLVKARQEGRIVITNVFINSISSIWIHLTQKIMSVELEKQLTVSGVSNYWNLEDVPQVSQNLLLCGDMWGGVGEHHF